jgi:hypothetical protein
MGYHTHHHTTWKLTTWCARTMSLVFIHPYITSVLIHPSLPPSLPGVPAARMRVRLGARARSPSSRSSRPLPAIIALRSWLRSSWTPAHDFDP